MECVNVNNCWILGLYVWSCWWNKDTVLTILPDFSSYSSLQNCWCNGQLAPGN
uniref:Protein SMG7 isoform X1 n=1 Tax=Rhizophora mucronata TaxID=61149 RepID=A0A2P2JSX2_RHIMU